MYSGNRDKGGNSSKNSVFSNLSQNTRIQGTPRRQDQKIETFVRSNNSFSNQLGNDNTQKTRQQKTEVDVGIPRQQIDQQNKRNITMLERNDEYNTISEKHRENTPFQGNGSTQERKMAINNDKTQTRILPVVTLKPERGLYFSTGFQTISDDDERELLRCTNSNCEQWLSSNTQRWLQQSIDLEENQSLLDIEMHLDITFDEAKVVAKEMYNKKIFYLRPDVNQCEQKITTCWNNLTPGQKYYFCFICHIMHQPEKFELFWFVIHYHTKIIESFRNIIDNPRNANILDPILGDAENKYGKNAFLTQLINEITEFSKTPPINVSWTYNFVCLNFRWFFNVAIPREHVFPLSFAEVANNEDFDERDPSVFQSLSLIFNVNKDALASKLPSTLLNYDIYGQIYHFANMKSSYTSVVNLNFIIFELNQQSKTYYFPTKESGSYNTSQFVVINGPLGNTKPDLWIFLYRFFYKEKNVFLVAPLQIKQNFQKRPFLPSFPYVYSTDEMKIAMGMCGKYFGREEIRDGRLINFAPYYLTRSLHEGNARVYQKFFTEKCQTLY